MKQLGICVVLMLLLSACASNELERCPADDWQVIGYEDGKRGNGPYSARSLRKSCNNIATPYDDAAYWTGQKRGLRDYCTKPNAYKLGRSGAAYKVTCPADLDAVFRNEYQLGLSHYQIDREADHLRDELVAAQKEQRRVEDQLQDLRSGSSRGSYGSYESELKSKQLMERLAWYDTRVRTLKSEIRKIENKIVEPDYNTRNQTEYGSSPPIAISSIYQRTSGLRSGNSEFVLTEGGVRRLMTGSALQTFNE